MNVTCPYCNEVTSYADDAFMCICPRCKEILCVNGKFVAKKKKEREELIEDLEDEYDRC